MELVYIVAYFCKPQAHHSKKSPKEKLKSGQALKDAGCKQIVLWSGTVDDSQQDLRKKWAWSNWIDLRVLKPFKHCICEIQSQTSNGMYYLPTKVPNLGYNFKEKGRISWESKRRWIRNYWYRRVKNSATKLL